MAQLQIAGQMEVKRGPHILALTLCNSLTKRMLATINAEGRKPRYDMLSAFEMALYPVHRCVQTNLWSWIQACALQNVSKRWRSCRLQVKWR